MEKFKGLESLEFEPQGVNLITGRNNTGKTSLLEAINLLFNPKGIKNYGLNYTHLIRENYDSSEISARLINSQTKLELGKLDHQEIWDEFIISFIDKYTSRFKANLERHMANRENINVSKSKMEELEETLYDGLRERFENKLANTILGNPIMMIKEGEEYPFVKPKVREVIDGEKIFKTIKEEINTWEKLEDKEIFSRLFIPPLDLTFHTQGFIRKVPKNSESVGIIENLDPRKLAENEDDEKVAVKEDDIEEYIKEKELLENLNSFSLNQLVFKKNGEKYGVPFEFMGDGFKTIVGILWHLMEGEYEEDIVLIEEPENNMHPGYTRELVYFLTDISRKHDTQFFITTHNRDFIEGFFGENLTENEKNYLEKEFLVLNLSKHGFNTYNYDESKSQMDDLLMDLRGI